MKKNHFQGDIWLRISDGRGTISCLHQLSLILLFVLVSTSTLFAQKESKPISIDVSDVAILDVLKSIESQSNYSFIFNNELVDVSQKVTLNVASTSINEVLKALFNDRKVSYLVQGNKVVLSPLGLNDKEYTIKGNVIDENGNSMPGVAIMVKGTDTGAITDIDGNYSLKVRGTNRVLVFSFIGYESQEMLFSGQKEINVRMRPDNFQVDEVLVIGYGTQKKASVTGAIATFDAEKLDERPVQRLDQAMVGQMAGVRVKQTSSMPGKGMSIQVRGTGSISASNEPLYVIDGFALAVSGQDPSGAFTSGSPLDNISPNDIESIQVLKDASAAAIYGSRAANGVVIITTKSGKTGKPKVSFNMSTGWNEEVRRLDVLNAEEWIDRATEVMNYTYLSKEPEGQNRLATDDYNTRLNNIGSFDRNQMPDPRWSQAGYPGLTFVDWQDEIFRKGMIQNYQLSANGGTDMVKYFVSSDYLNQEGIFKSVDYERFSIRTNVVVKPNDKLTAGINLSPSYSVNNDPGVEGKDNILHVAVGMPPLTDTDVGLDMNVGENTSLVYGNSRNSPVRVLEKTIGETRIFRTLATVFAEYEFLKGLKYRSSVNLDNTDQRYKYYRPAIVSGKNPGARNASGRYTTFNRMTFANENTLAFNRKINEKHNISAVGGFSFSSNKLENSRIYSSEGFKSDYITTLNDAVGISSTNTYTNETKSTLVSGFGRINYNLSDRYLFSASLRRDGSSRFGRDTKWGTFPAASVGWRISEEAFMQSFGWLSNFKVRTSWGIAGNDAAPSDYGHLEILKSSGYSFGNIAATGWTIDNFPNRDLGWEESETYTFGLDYGLMGNRVYGSIEYYTKTNTNLLLNIPVPRVSGYDEALTNIGEVYNHGWDIELTTRNITGQFEWTTNFNIGFNANEVRKLGPDNAPILGGAFDIYHNVLKVGEPMYSVNVVKQIGILTAEDIAKNSDADPNNDVALYNTQKVGDPRYEDYNGDGVISTDDRQILGHPNPDYTWGVNNTFKYKGFDLGILIQGQQGGVIYSTFGRAVDRTGMGWLDNAIGAWDNRWRSAEDPGDGLKGKAYSTFGRIKNTDWMYSSDYWRVRNITLGYDLGRLIHSDMISNARVYLTAENWFGDDKYDGGFNPEAVNNSGDDYGGAPLARSVVIGVNLTF